MVDSLQKELWKGYKYLPCLKELELYDMKALVRTPDFGGLPCLQKLILDDCESLEEIHESLGSHSSLVSVEVRGCEKLRRFPSIVGMEKLEILRISDCPALAEFPIRIEGKMDNLVELYLDKVGIEVLPSSVTNLFSLELRYCLNLKSIEGNFQELIKLNLHGCRLKDGEIPTEIGEFFGLQQLCLGGNEFTRLDSLSRLIRLKLLDVSDCKNLVELPELPSRLAILKADCCWLLEAVIRDEIHTNCKWLSQVSIVKDRRINKNIIGGERLLKTMLQGNAVESRCLSLQLQGLEIAGGFEPGLVRGRRCGMQLPENWFNHFSGFLFCAATSKYFIEWPVISMKHGEEEENGGWMGMGDSHHDNFYWEEDSVDDGRDESDDGSDESVDEDDGSWGYTWVGYIPFSILRDTSWWDPTSTAIQMKIDDKDEIRGCGFKLVPKRGGAESSSSGQMETTTTFHSSSSSEFPFEHNYKCQFHILHDSRSALECSIDYFDSE